MPRRDEVLSLFVDGSLIAKGNRLDKGSANSLDREDFDTMLP